MTLALEEVALERGGRTLLEGLSLRFETGVTALLGPNGVGKTTLLRALAGSVIPQRGRVALDGRDVHALHPRDRARRIGLIESTEPVLSALTVEDAVGAARYAHHRWWEWEPTAEDRDAVDEALARTQLVDLREREVGTLSAGERQRVWIALAIAQRAGIVLLDEPTSHLDLKASVETLRLVRELAAGGALVVAVLHALEEAASFADRIVLLGCGGVLADGVPAAALTAENIERAYGVPVVVEAGPGGLVFRRT